MLLAQPLWHQLREWIASGYSPCGNRSLGISDGSLYVHLAGPPYPAIGLNITLDASVKVFFICGGCGWHSKRQALGTGSCSPQGRRSQTAGEALLEQRLTSLSKLQLAQTSLDCSSSPVSGRPLSPSDLGFAMPLPQSHEPMLKLNLSLSVSISILLVYFVSPTESSLPLMEWVKVGIYFSCGVWVE